jgi:hypothetical protein
MKELLELKNRFGLKDARVDAGLDKLSCAGTDFISRISGEIGSKGRMATSAGGTAPVPTPMEAAISAMTPANYNADDIENLVQTITDQIMAAAS